MNEKQLKLGVSKVLIWENVDISPRRFPTNPRKSVLVCYDLHNYKRLNNYVNDIVEKINFKGYDPYAFRTRDIPTITKMIF